ncbi:MAG: hypothetical protein ACRD8O_03320 [Bryobacteraceae bacterium]
MDSKDLPALVAAFEEGTLDVKQWTHRAHLSVAFWHLQRFSAEDALNRMRAGIMHYNECTGTPNTATRGYHETLTRFWIGVIRRFVRVDPSLPRLLEAYGSRSDLWRDYYSFDVVRSTGARAGWVAPDLLQLDD